MVKIYCIEDINDLKYVGQTKRDLSVRLTEHRYSKRKRPQSTSCQLNLYNCIIYLLEECDEDKLKEREYYWINKIDCVNYQDGNFDQVAHAAWRYKNHKQYWKDYYLKKKLSENKIC